MQSEERVMGRLSTSMLGAVACAAAMLPGLPAAAGTIVVTVSGTISNTSGDFAGQATIGGAVTATVELDDTVAGVFTPSSNPTFVRSEMLYSGAISSSTVTIDGNVVSGSGGDIRLLDAATGSLAGEDNYEINALLDTGSVGTGTPASVSFVGEYGDATLTVGASDPLAAPPAFDAGRFNPYTVTSTTGGTIFGQLSALSGSVAGTVPLAAPAIAVGLALALVVVGARALRSRDSASA